MEEPKKDFPEAHPPIPTHPVPTRDAMGGDEAHQAENFRIMPSRHPENDPFLSKSPVFCS